MNSRRSFLRMTAKVTRRAAAPKPVEPETAMPIQVFDCCGERIKHDGSSARLYCIVCGTPGEQQASAPVRGGDTNGEECASGRRT